MKRSARLRVQGARVARPIASRALRAALLVALVLLFRWRFGEADVEPPIHLGEVRSLLPEATALHADAGRRGGVGVFDEFGQMVGRAVRTLPDAADIVGYAGPTDMLVVFDGQGRIAGIRVRDSADTVNHVDDVKADAPFIALLDGLTWEQAAAFDLRASPIDAVSGATLTSRAMIDGVIRRLNGGDAPLPWRFGLRDAIAVLVLGGGILLAFAGRDVRRPVSVGFAIAAVFGLGFVGGDFVTQSVLLGWAREGMPWRTAPGLVLLSAFAFLLPWGTGRNVYCQRVCPHGLLQDLIARISPWRLRLRPDLRRALRLGPWALLLIATAWALLEAPFELARLEPFDAYLLTAGAGASIAWAVGSLVLAVFVPRGYCRFACPTGALLDVARVRISRR